jgi:hypothetical protein
MAESTRLRLLEEEASRLRQHNDDLIREISVRHF